MTTDQERVLVISASIGAGHDGAADQLAARLAADGFRTDRLDFVDLLPAGLGLALRRAYRAQLTSLDATWGWLLGAADRPGALSDAAVRVAALAGPRILRAVTPDTVAVVSTYPMASQALGELRAGGELPVPVLTYLTDMSVHRLWVAPGVDAHLAIHPVAAAQARRWDARRVAVTAPLVSSRFVPAGDGASRAAARARLGLPAGRLALIVTGSWGVGDFDHTVRDVDDIGGWTAVVACGGNERARRRLADRGVVALGWVHDMPALLHACDVVVQNAGGLTSLEALACRRPVVTYRCLPGHGRMNAAALHESGWVPWLRTPAELEAVLRGELWTPYPPSEGATGVVEVVRQLAVPVARPVLVA
jgi:UDP-N-acetylglucosamine:LPS N-acetylglucosamine transferase